MSAPKCAPPDDSAAMTTIQDPPFRVTDESQRSSTSDILAAVARLGPGPLTEAGLIEHLHPLFSRALDGGRGTIYLANHSLGRPPDRTAQDVAGALDAWYRRRDEAWEDWLAAREWFRRAIARLIGAPRSDCIVPRANAAQGLRTVLNAYDAPVPVISTGGEFVSIDHVLGVYAQRGRIALTLVEPGPHGEYRIEDIIKPMGQGALVVVSMVFFVTGQRLGDLDALIGAAHARGARVLLDLYHAAGAVPVDVATLDADFAIGGCYKYLRGGPGAGYLYVHPRHLDDRLGTLDSGWFARADPLSFERSELRFASGGDALLEATPAVLPWFQARAGLELALALGVERLRAYSLEQQTLLCEGLAQHGIAVRGQAERRGNFLAVAHPRAAEISDRLKAAGVITDAREGHLRLCPDILNTEGELAAAEAIRSVAGIGTGEGLRP